MFTVLFGKFGDFVVGCVFLDLGIGELFSPWPLLCDVVSPQFIVFVVGGCPPPWPILKIVIHHLLISPLFVT